MVSFFEKLMGRGKYSAPAAILHFIVSVLVAAAAAVLIFGYWFHAPLAELMGGRELFWLIVAVDVVCGPLMTFIVFGPGKSQFERAVDLIIIILIQLCALGYGIYTLGYARPVALVYEVDRFRLISYADLDEADAVNAPEWLRPWSSSPMRTVGLKSSEASLEAKMKSIDASLQGVEPSQRPSRWQDYEMSAAQVLERARPMSDLRLKHPTKSDMIIDAAAIALEGADKGETRDMESLRWLPLVSRWTTDWVVLIDPVSARVRGYLHLDGF